MKTALSILRAETEDQPYEAELATVERLGDRIMLVLDDGETIDCDASELAAALEVAA